MFKDAPHQQARPLWANLHLLFWLSLVPFAAAWMSEHQSFANRWLGVAVYVAVALTMRGGGGVPRSQLTRR